MDRINEMLQSLLGKMTSLAKNNAVTSKPISVGERHVLPLCEFRMGYGGGGGFGEGAIDSDESNKPGIANGEGHGAGGGAKITPVATIIVDGDDIRIETFDR